MSDENDVAEVAEEQEIVSHAVTGDANAQSMNDLLESGAEIRVLKPGDMVEGTMISVSKNEVYIDLAGYGVGVVRGRELYDDQATLNSLKTLSNSFARSSGSSIRFWSPIIDFMNSLVTFNFSSCALES